MTRTNPVMLPISLELRIAIDRIIAVGDSPCSTMGWMSIDGIGETVRWIDVVCC